MSNEDVVMHEVSEVQLFNPEEEQEEQISRIDFEGNAIAEHDLIRDRIDDGYVMKGLTARVNFDNEYFDIAVSGSDMMSYAKVEDIGDYEKAQRLMDILREKYMDELRI